jgi:hypothetical protein
MKEGSGVSRFLDLDNVEIGNGVCVSEFQGMRTEDGRGVTSACEKGEVELLTHGK